MHLQVIFETLKNFKTESKKFYLKYEKFNEIFHICVKSFGLES